MMRIGIERPSRAAVFLPESGIPFGLPELIETGVRAEELGFAIVTVPQSLIAKPRWAPIPILGALAARTRRVKIGTTIIQPLFWNNPVLLAQDLVTLDVMSQGRLMIGLGLGAGRPELVEQELALCGVEKRTRGKRFTENIEVLRRLLTEDEVTFHGQFYKLDKVRLGLRPAQRPKPPFWIAGASFVSGDLRRYGIDEATQGQKMEHIPIGSVPTADRIAKYADGWLVDATSSEKLGENLRMINQLAAERYGRPPNSIEGVWIAGLSVNDDNEAAFEEARWYTAQWHQMPIPDDVNKNWLISGRGPECVEQLQRYEAAGAGTFMALVRTRHQAEQIERIAREVLPAFQ